MAETLRVVPTGSRAALQPAAKWVQWFARLGFASRGVVYIVMGWLALQLARGFYSNNPDTSGAFASVLGAPAGRVLLAVIAAGLGCYTLWRVYVAIANPERDSVGKRFHHLWIAGVHVVLTLAAARIAWTNGSGGNSGDQDMVTWTARAMSLPIGRWIVIGTGIGLAVYGLYQLYRAAKADLDDMLDLSELEPARRKLLRRISRFGMAARGVVFVLIGMFVVRAGWEYDATEARGFSGSLEAMRGAPYGAWLLGVIAFGIASYGIYSLVRARYRIVRTH
jgi:hypothetical protein